MPVLDSKLDTNAEVFKQNKADMMAMLSTVEELLEEASRGGGEEAIALPLLGARSADASLSRTRCWSPTGLRRRGRTGRSLATHSTGRLGRTSPPHSLGWRTTRREP